MFEDINWYVLGPIIVVVVLIILAIFFPKIFRSIGSWFSRFIKALASQSGGASDVTGNENIDNLIAIAGYSYDPEEDVFYSGLNAWQRKMGYSRLFDEAAAAMGMIIDCEPIYFSYGGKKWMIEFWKGQYDLTTGCEIGVYTLPESKTIIPEIISEAFYNCASDDDLLQMSLSLKKNNKTIFKRDQKHWWLTGFKLGEFSEPHELAVDLKITLKDDKMCEAFVSGLKEAGYKEGDFEVSGTTVVLTFDQPHTTQPITRTPETDKIIQQKNKLLCDEYQRITKNYDKLPDKLKAVQEQAPELYEHVLKFGKPKGLFNILK